MSKILFAPVGAVAGKLAGLVGKRVFTRVWSLVDGEQPPDPKRRDITWSKLLVGLLLQGAIFRAARGLFDRAARQSFSKLTGTWPGEQRPDSS
ncbi:MAG TPA: DUF4235 domain-containing protein [Solirubrobacteraceae bacterium]|jgi:hypothetical protein|nr:DUF4235 domain-containing protein [Solirubrobacteraceae bacterium]